MGKKKDKTEIALCPVGRFFMELERFSGGKSDFFDHLTRSRLEFLRAIRSLVDERIGDLEKKDSKGGKKKATKITIK